MNKCSVLAIVITSDDMHVTNIPLDSDDGPFRTRNIVLVHWSLGDDLNSPTASTLKPSLTYC